MSNPNWSSSYVGKLRKIIGHQLIIHPSIRAIIKNSDGELLFIERREENKWGMPSGSIELNESIYDCLVREVKEETGLTVLSATLIVIYTSPSKAMVNRFGITINCLNLCFELMNGKVQLQRKLRKVQIVHFIP